MASSSLQIIWLVCGLVGVYGVESEHKNFCKPLEDYGPRKDEMETRYVCKTEMNKKCEPVTESGCLDVTEIRCEVLLTTNCTMDWTNKDRLESVMSVKERNLRNCTKEMVREFHSKTVYDCRNVTKIHCTTLWTVDDKGDKVWAGNEDDCRDVTWEECFPVVKEVPMSVAQMNCAELPISYFDYENITTSTMADKMDCSVDKVPVCRPITSTKCDEVTYTRCQEEPETVCTTVEIPVPAQPKLHKQWCLFDQEENINFDLQVRRIEEEAISRQKKVASFVGELEPIFTDYTDVDTQDQQRFEQLAFEQQLTSEQQLTIKQEITLEQQLAAEQLFAAEHQAAAKKQLNADVRVTAQQPEQEPTQQPEQKPEQEPKQEAKLNTFNKKRRNAPNLKVHRIHKPQSS